MIVGFIICKVNWNKSEAVLVGEWGGGGPTLPDGLTWRRGGFKYLGVCSGDSNCSEKNWDGMVEKVKVCLSKWKWLVPQMSFRGRVLVINNLAASSLACEATGCAGGFLFGTHALYSTGNSTPAKGGGDQGGQLPFISSLSRDPSLIPENWFGGRHHAGLCVQPEVWGWTELCFESTLKHWILVGFFFFRELFIAQKIGRAHV